MNGMNNMNGNEQSGMTFNFDLTEQEVMLLLDGLGELQFKKVIDLVFKIRTQIQEQVDKHMVAQMRQNATPQETEMSPNGDAIEEES